MNRKNRPRHRFVSCSSQAFARIDLLVLLVALILIAVITLPLGAGQRTVSTRSEQLVCLANLRHIGRAYQLWASEHDDQKPFLIDPSSGGIRWVGVANNLWYQFAYISNELATPRVLACPSDTNTTRIARNFTSNADGGLLNPGYRNNAISYFLALHAFRDDPRAILGGDRNLRPTGSSGCSYAGLSTVSVLDGRSMPPLVWTNAIHGLEGNVLFNDGTAVTMSTAEFQNVLLSPATDVQRIHFLLPR